MTAIVNIFSTLTAYQALFQALYIYYLVNSQSSQVRYRDCVTDKEPEAEGN